MLIKAQHPSWHITWNSRIKLFFVQDVCLWSANVSKLAFPNVWFNSLFVFVEIEVQVQPCTRASTTPESVTNCYTQTELDIRPLLSPKERNYTMNGSLEFTAQCSWGPLMFSTSKILTFWNWVKKRDNRVHINPKISTKRGRLSQHQTVEKLSATTCIMWGSSGAINIWWHWLRKERLQDLDEWSHVQIGQLHSAPEVVHLGRGSAWPGTFKANTNDHGKWLHCIYTPIPGTRRGTECIMICSLGK